MSITEQMEQIEVWADERGRFHARGPRGALSACVARDLLSAARPDASMTAEIELVTLNSEFAHYREFATSSF